MRRTTVSQVHAIREIQPATLDLAGRLTATVVPLARLLRQQIDGGLSATELWVLGAIHRLGPVRMSDLAVRERLSPPMITKVVTSLIDAGLVERQRDPDDGRSWLIAVSEDGARWCLENRVLRDEWLAARLQELTTRERSALAAALPVLELLTDDDR